ncbi:hypothetical protein C9374_000229 [Naegleria lovaniensis]|uniref:3'-5' exonuclease n=1 Tax=Naegleria lovaniensis TaxID=51637 RepID=A0AA88GTV5_NAELO|nr:uncharacterized protein C9374_000229 [Naegleria lovaniensis]KAG2388790.1 hypothetical protein C9374_000229 [Naegleria lovaniensis]
MTQNKPSHLLVETRERSNSEVSNDDDEEEEEEEVVDHHGLKQEDDDMKSELKSLVSEVIEHSKEDQNHLEEPPMEIGSVSNDTTIRGKLTMFSNCLVNDFVTVFKDNPEQRELVYDSLFYPHHIRSVVLQEKRKKKSTPSNPLSSPTGMPGIIDLDSPDNDMTAIHLYYLIAILKERQRYQIKQYLNNPNVRIILSSQVEEYPIINDDSIQLHYNDFGVSIDTLCYCLESNRYIELSDEGKLIKTLRNSFLKPIVITKKKLVAFLSLYPDLFEITKPRKQLDVISLKFLCFSFDENYQLVDRLRLELSGNVVRLVGRASGEIECCSIDFRNLPEKKILDVNNEEHIKLILKILSEDFPKNRTAFKLSVLRKVIFNKYDYKPFNLVSFLCCFPQHFQINPKANKKVKRILPAVDDYKPRIENLMFGSGVESKKSQSSNVVDSALTKPLFELPASDQYTVVFATNPSDVDDWIEKYIYQALEVGGEDTVVVGMDTEFDLFKLNKNYQLNPVLHEKLWKLFKKQKQFCSTTGISIYNNAESEYLKTQYFKEFEQTAFPDLIQLSTGSSCLLYGGCEGIHAPSPLFVQLMYDKRVLKTWCSYGEDVKLIKLWFQHFEMAPQGKEFESLIELDASQKGASYLCEQLLGMKMAKERSVQVSRWSRLNLSTIQKKYAAQDSYLNWLLFSKMESERKDYSTLEDTEDISFSLFDPTTQL